MGHSSGHGPGVGPDGVGGVEDDAAHAAHVLLVPARSPAVPHDPVVALGGVRAVPDQLHGVVDGDVGGVRAALKHAAAVGAPGAGVYGHGEGPDLGQVLHHLVLVVGGEDLVAGEPHAGRHAVVVVLAVSGHTVTGSVGP